MATVRGRVVSGWINDGSEYRFQIELPANTSADVHLPIVGKGSITESGVPVRQSRGVKCMGATQGMAHFAVESGAYEFVVPK